MSLIEQLFTTGNFGHIAVTNFLLNTVFVWIIVHFLYYKKSKHRNFYFTFLMLSIAIYFLVYFMVFVLEDLKGKTGIGVGIGLFGIFSIMRYRTDTMPVREMTYLFSVICLSVINALGTTIPVVELLLPNIIILATMCLCEFLLLSTNEVSKLIQYDRIELIKPEKHDELIADLKQRTGLDITRLRIGSVDMLRDSAIIKVYYKDNGDIDATINNQVKIRKTEWEDVK
ncbi:MAG: DUF4956 domain-containing protein [Bacteroidales bacterium]|nr:DUF4956 domain-containing protein [Candidatus Sodaliphilus fimicaballi]